MAGTGAGFGKWDLGAGRSGEQRYSGKPDGDSRNAQKKSTDIVHNDRSGVSHTPNIVEN